MFRQFAFEAQVAIVGPSDGLPVEIGIAHQHDAFHIQHYPASPPGGIGSEPMEIPSAAHLLESACAESAFHVGRSIRFVGLFVGRRLHPWLANLEVVGQIHLHSPLCGYAVGGYGLSVHCVSGHENPFLGERYAFPCLGQGRQAVEQNQEKGSPGQQMIISWHIFLVFACKFTEK